MNIRTIFFSLFLLLSVKTFSQIWVNHPAYGVSITGSIKSISFSQLSNGCIGGDYLFRTSDGGNSWSKITGNSSNANETMPTNIRKINFSGGNGLAIKSDGYWETSNGINFYDYGYLWNIYAIQPIADGLTVSNTTVPKRLFIGNNAAYFYNFYNGSSTKTVAANVSLNSIIPVKSNIYYIAASGNSTGYVYEANFVNQTISLKNSYAGNGFNAIYMVDSVVGYVVGEKGTIRKTIDKGINWQLQNSNTTENLNSVYFVSSDTGYVVGNGGVILSTQNGGTTWQSQVITPTETYNTVYFANSKKGFIGGNNSFLKYCYIPKVNLLQDTNVVLCPNSSSIIQFDATSYIQDADSYSWTFPSNVTNITNPTSSETNRTD